MSKLVGIVYDSQSLTLHMVVMPDSEAELDDKAYNPPGFTQLRVSVATYAQVGGLIGAQSLVPGWQPPTDPAPK